MTQRKVCLCARQPCTPPSVCMCVRVNTRRACVCCCGSLVAQQRVWVLPRPPLQWPRHGLMVSLILPLKWMTSAPPTCARVAAWCPASSPTTPCVPTPPYALSCNGWIAGLPSYPSMAWHSVATAGYQRPADGSRQWTPLPILSLCVYVHSACRKYPLTDMFLWANAHISQSQGLCLMIGTYIRSTDITRST